MEPERRSIGRRPRAGLRRAAGGLIAAVPPLVLAIALSGCLPFNRTPQQEEYFNALKIGNSAQASQIWLHMTPDQRAKFGRGEGIRPSGSSKDVQQKVGEHYYHQ